jgi:hypothetical protein
MSIRSGRALTSGGGGTFLSTSGRYAGPGHVGYFSESGIEFLTYHFYYGLHNGAPTLALSSLRWDSAGWPYASADWIANGRYQIVNRGDNLAWDNRGCGYLAGQAIAQAPYTGVMSFIARHPPQSRAIRSSRCGLIIPTPIPIPEAPSPVTCCWSREPGG